MELSTPEPWLPVVRTCKRPSGPVLTMPRWYSVRPGFLRMGSWQCACSSGNGFGVAPIICNSAGRTRAKKVTMTATGLPGRPKSTVLPIRPSANGRPGRIAMRQNATSPNWAIIPLVKSASPTLTPPLLMITSACAAALRKAASSATGSSRTTPSSMTSQPSRSSRLVTV